LKIGILDWLIGRRPPAAPRAAGEPVSLAGKALAAPGASAARVASGVSEATGVAEQLRALLRASADDDVAEMLRLSAALRVVRPALVPAFRIGALALERFGDPEGAAGVLREAGIVFADEAWPLIDAAGLAERQGAFQVASGHARRMRERFAGDSSGYRIGFRVLSLLGDADAARDLLVQAQTWLPGESWPLLEALTLAQRAGETERAVEVAAQLRERFPEQPQGFLTGSFLLRRMGRAEEAEAALAAGLSHHGASVPFQSERARVAAQRSDWAEACDRAAALRECSPESAAGWQIGQLGLRRTDRLDEADALLRDAHEWFAGEEWLLGDFARVAQQRRDWAEAARRWTVYRDAFPDAAAGFVGGALAARQAGEMETAEGLLDRAAMLAPDDIGVHLQRSQLAQQRQDWAEAERRWSEARARFPASPEAAIGAALLPSQRPDQPDGLETSLGRLEAIDADIAGAAPVFLARLSLLRRARRFADAEALAGSALARHPDDPMVALAHAQAARDAGNYAAALARYEQVTQRFPREVPGFVHLATGLAQAGQTERAEAVCLSAMAVFPHRSEPVCAYAEIAARRHDWPTALQRWTAAAERFPSDRTIRTRLFETRLAFTEPLVEPSVAAPSAGSDSEAQTEA
jgi:tetratricopeptide (TPR) repeat protein